MEELRKQNIRLGNILMTKFQEFRANLPPENDYSLESRMKRTLFYGLHQNYIDIWRKNEQFLHNYETKLKQHLQLQSKISEWCWSLTNTRYDDDTKFIDSIFQSIAMPQRRKSKSWLAIKQRVYLWAM